MKSRRRGDLFHNASVAGSCVTRRECTPNALVRKDPFQGLERSLIRSLERNVCLSPQLGLDHLLTSIPLREALYSDRPSFA